MLRVGILLLEPSTPAVVLAMSRPPSVCAGPALSVHEVELVAPPSVEVA
jgi:hypothetical protein